MKGKCIDCKYGMSFVGPDRRIRGWIMCWLLSETPGDGSGCERFELSSFLRQPFSCRTCARWEDGRCMSEQFNFYATDFSWMWPYLPCREWERGK